MLAPTVTLSNGHTMPVLGLGTWPMNNAEVAVAVSTAVQLGYRLFDTAENYQNEVGVGEGLRCAGVARESVFITTKFNRQWHSFDGVRTACLASLQRLGLDYLDLLLIHWPNPEQDRYVEAYEGMCRLQQDGLVRSIGTSNFKPLHLQRLFDAGHCPQVNQIQLDPYHARDDLLALHRANGIQTQTWRPLGFGSALLQEPVVLALAAQHQRTPAQVVLRWAVQQGLATVPKSASPKRLAENLVVFDFVLTDSEMQQLSALQRVDPGMFDADAFGH